MQAGMAGTHPANGLSWNESNELSFDMNCVWMDSNGLYYLMGVGWSEFYVNMDWSGFGMGWNGFLCKIVWLYINVDS